MFKKGFLKPAQWTASTHKAFVPVTFGNWQEMNTSPETENIFLEAFISLVLSSSLMLHVGLVLKDYHSAVVWGQKKIQHSWVGSSQDVGPQQWDNAASQILLGWALTKLASVSVPSAAPPQHLSPLLFFSSSLTFPLSLSLSSWLRVELTNHIIVPGRMSWEVCASRIWDLLTFIPSCCDPPSYSMKTSRQGFCYRCEVVWLWMS